jgi:hypothetical protein
MNATWEIEEAFCLSTKDKTPADLGGKYILISNASGVKYKIWFDVNNASTEPTVASTTGISVEVATGATSAQIATAIKVALDAVVAFGYTITILESTTVKGVFTSTAVVANGPENGTAGASLDLTRVQIGGSIDLGLLDGDVTFDPSVETQDITAHQTGAIILGQNIIGLGGSVSLTLKEYSPSRYRDLYFAVGGKAATGNVYGMGSAMVGKNLLLFAKRLVLKPVGSTDDTTSYTFWKSVPDLGSHTFSGENPTTLPLEFTSYIDDDKDANVNVWAFGDTATLV